MFALKRADGSWILSTRTGARMTWSSRRLARAAVRHIAKARNIPVAEMRVVDA